MGWTLLRENAAPASTSDGELAALGGHGIAWWRGDGVLEFPKLGPFYGELLALHGRLYGVRNDQRREVLEIAPDGSAIVIGTGFSNLCGCDAPGDAVHLFAHGSHGVYRYLGRPGAWERIGGPLAQLALVRRRESFDAVVLFGLSSDHGAVLRWDGAVDAWTTVGGAASSITGTPDGTLIAVDPATGVPYMFELASGRWLDFVEPAGSRRPYRPGGIVRAAPFARPLADLYYLTPPDAHGRRRVFARRGPQGPLLSPHPLRVFGWWELGEAGPVAEAIFDSREGSRLATARDGHLWLHTWSRPTVNRQTFPSTAAGDPVAIELTAAGGVGGPYRLVLASGVLPPGVELSDHGLHGRPVHAGRFGFQVVAFDAAGTASDPYPAELVVTPPRPAPSPGPPPPPAGFRGFSRVAVYNCRTGWEVERPGARAFVRNLTTGSPWHDAGPLDTSWRKGRTCPAPEAEPVVVDLTEGVNEIRLVDSTLIGCGGGSVEDGLCIGAAATFLGHPMGPEYAWVA